MCRCQLVGVLGAVLLTATAPGRAGDELIDPNGRWEKFEAGKGKIICVYYEDGKWNIRATSPEGKRAQFKGTVTVTGDVVKGDVQGLEPARNPRDADWAKRHKDQKGFDFQLTLGGKVDAINFTVGPKAESVAFHIQTDGDDDPKVIRIGSGGDRPGKAKFSLVANPPASAPKSTPTPERKKKK